jgi:predicted amidohydrolase YtcJ
MNWKNYTSLVGLLGFLIASCVPGDNNGNQDSADLILSGAKIFTSNEEQPWAEAVAIKEGRFIYVGDSPGATQFRSDSTRSIDLGGRLVIPGLVDAHAHPGYIDVEQYGAISETNEEELLAAVRKYAEEHPDDEWLRLCCWPLDLYVHGDQGPIRQTSKALEVLGVDKDTPDPAPGIGMYARDENGVPTGWVKEGAGWQYFTEHFEIKDDAHKLLHEQSMVAGLQVLSESGVTTLYDAGNFGFEDLIYGFMANLEQEGDLPVRYEGTYQIFSPDRVQFAIPEMKRYRNEYGGERLQDDPAYVGKTMLTAEELRDFLLELNEEKFDIHIHTMSDLAVRVVLDAVEAAKDIAKVDFYPRVTNFQLHAVVVCRKPRRSPENTVWRGSLRADVHGEIAL